MAKTDKKNVVENLPVLKNEVITQEKFDIALKNLQPSGKIKDKIFLTQKSIIDVLKKEGVELKTINEVITSPFNVKKDEKTVDNICNLLNTVAKLDNDIQQEKADLVDLDSQIGKIKKTISRLRKKAKHVSQKSEPSANTINILKNNLHDYNLKLGEKTKDNKKLQSDIHTQLKTLSRYNECYDALMNNLNFGKTTIKDILDQTDWVYNEREKLITRLVKLKEKEKEMHKVQCIEMYEAVRSGPIEEANQMFFNAKTKDRHLVLNKKKKLISAEKEKCKMLKIIAEYGKVFDEIRDYHFERGITSVDMIGRHYEVEESELFQQFLYVNELNNELESLKRDLNDKINKYIECKDTESEEEYKRNAKLKELNSILLQNQSLRISLQNSMEHQEKQLTVILEGIQQIFLTLDCDNNPLLLFLGDHTNVNENNYTLFLRVIEEKLHEILSFGEFPLRQDLISMERLERPTEYPIITEDFATLPCNVCKDYNKDGEGRKTNVHFK
uniref:ODAD1 central coiled coil region domain-containing protein n=1 Tax=Clastoptera arizonana TaxID=38151 RepID=A0A1B6CRB0_9HEMI